MLLKSFPLIFCVSITFTGTFQKVKLNFINIIVQVETEKNSSLWITFRILWSILKYKQKCIGT